jgi:membrane protease YdiL (CAAX protease family)
VFPEPAAPPTDTAPPPSPTPTERLVVLLEVLMCSDFPTQLALGSTFAAFGYGPYGADGQLRVAYVVGLSLVDTAALLCLVALFLYAHGERPRDLIFGRQSPAREAAYGVPLIFVALGIAVAVLLSIQHWAPSLHTVAQNPLERLLSRPRDIWLFALVSIVAGGIREETQRAFLLHRFEVWLGGGLVGVTVTSIAFGVGHLIQGVDAAVATALLGAFWGVVYLRRRSAVAPMVSHAGFDLLQILQVLAGR